MKHIIILEFLSFGLELLIKDILKRGYKPIFITKDINFYTHSFNCLVEHNLIDKIIIIITNTLNANDVIKELSSYDNIKGIISNTDTFSFVGLAIAKHFNLPFLSEDTLKICRNKLFTRQVLAKNNLPTIQSCIVNSKIAYNNLPIKINFPLILKDSSGTGSVDVSVANNEEEFNMALSSLLESTLKGEVLIEEYIYGTLFSAECVSFNHKHKILAISSRIMGIEPDFKEINIALPINLPNELYKKIEQFIFDTLCAVNYKSGFSHIEFMITKNNDLMIIEINPRLGGMLIGYGLCDILDTNIYSFLIDIALEIEPSILTQNIAYTCGVAFEGIYGDKLGIYNGINIDNIIKNKPGNITLYNNVANHYTITTTKDKRPLLALLNSKDINSELALYHLKAAVSSGIHKLNIISKD